MHKNNYRIQIKQGGDFFNKASTTAATTIFSFLFTSGHLVIILYWLFKSFYLCTLFNKTFGQYFFLYYYYRKCNIYYCF